MRYDSIIPAPGIASCRPSGPSWRWKSPYWFSSMLRLLFAKARSDGLNEPLPVLQCVAGCCSVLQYYCLRDMLRLFFAKARCDGLNEPISVLQCVAVCCSVL